MLKAELPLFCLCQQTYGNVVDVVQEVGVGIFVIDNKEHLLRPLPIFYICFSDRNVIIMVLLQFDLV